MEDNTRRVANLSLSGADSRGANRGLADTPYQSLDRSPTPLLHSQETDHRLFTFSGSDTVDQQHAPDATMPKSGFQISVFLINSPDDEDIVSSFNQSVSWLSQNVIKIHPAFGPQAPTRRVRSGIPEYIYESISKNGYTILLIGPTFTEEIQQTRDGDEDGDNEVLGNRCALFQLLNGAFLKSMDMSKVFPVLVKEAGRQHLPWWLKAEEFYKNGAERSGVKCLVRKMIDQYQAEHSVQSS